MRQSEIQFFWPLTEQIQLDLDYTNCEKPLSIFTSSLIGAGTMTYDTFNSNGYMAITASSLSIDVETTTFKVTEEPPWYRKLLYKLLNIQWVKK